MSGDSATVGAEQLRLIRNARAFLDTRQAHGADVAVDPQCYLNSWAPTLGNKALRRLAFGWHAEPARLVARLKDMADFIRSPDMAVAGDQSGRHEFEHLIVSWALPQDFDSEGHYTDRYLGLGSKDTPRVLWFLILLSGAPPVELPPNIRVSHGASGVHPPAPRPSGSAVLGTLRRLSNDWAPASGHRLSGTTARARSLAAAVGKLACGRRFRRLVMPYEAQPFQHAINLTVKALDPGVTTVGYLHSALPALPTDLIFRSGAPDRLLVHGAGQSEILTRLLGWPADRLQTIPSLRYLRQHAAPLAGRILLPYSFDDAHSISHALEAVLQSAAVASMPRWEVRNHPVMANSRKHVALTERLRAIVERYSDRLSQEQTVSGQTLIIGATAAVLEALERGLEVIHVCVDPLFETHSDAIWTHLRVEALARNVFRYRLREPGLYIRLGETQAAARESLGLDA